MDVAIVNLVSCDEEEHDAFVGVDGAWTQTTSGIAHLREAGVEVYTFTALHRVNVHRVKEIHKFAKEELGVHALFYQYILQVKGDPLIPDKEAWAAAKHFVLCEANKPHARFVRNFNTLVGSACSGGYFVFTVKVDGTVTPCPFISDISLGNIKERSIWEIIWARFSVPGFIEFQSLPAECRDCAYADICNGGCKAGNVAMFGRYDRKDSRCLGPWKEQIQEEAVSDRLPCFF